MRIGPGVPESPTMNQVLRTLREECVGTSLLTAPRLYVGRGAAAGARISIFRLAGRKM